MNIPLLMGEKPLSNISRSSNEGLHASLREKNTFGQHGFMKRFKSHRLLSKFHQAMTKTFHHLTNYRYKVVTQQQEILKSPYLNDKTGCFLRKEPRKWFQ